MTKIICLKVVFFNRLNISIIHLWDEFFSKKSQKNIVSFRKGCTFAPAKQSNRVLFQAGPVVQLG